MNSIFNELDSYCMKKYPMITARACMRIFDRVKSFSIDHNQYPPLELLDRWLDEVCNTYYG